MSIVAIITARGGSKRIPRKNIKDFMGKPMIAYAIEAALKSGIFDEVMVSTEDNGIAEIAKKYRAKIPFIRSEKNASDFATTYDVLEEVINEYKKIGKEFQQLCCIYPCVPFLTYKILQEAYKIFNNTDCDTLVPIVRYSYPIQRAFMFNEKKLLEYREPENALKRSQDLEPMYHDAGMFYFCDTKEMLKNKSDIGKKVIGFELQEKCVQDIDNEEDWEIAKQKFAMITDKENYYA